MTMRKQTLNIMLLGLIGLGFGSCSGSGTSTSSASIHCANGASFCLVSCDLGCSLNGCAVTEIAENQPLRFVFSQEVKSSSVTQSSFSIRTVAGQPPDGDFVFDRNAVTFLPRIRVLNGVTSFGFQRNETYLITIVGGGSQGIKSLSGATLKTDFNCQVSVTRGIIDGDQRPPDSTLVSPTDLTNAPVTPTIVVRFTELIDPTPFTGSSLTSPIRYQLRRALIDPVTGAPSCDLSGSPIVLEGVPRVTVEQFGGHDVSVVTMRPNSQLPGQACVQVLVTADVRDLAGTPAIARTYDFFTAAGSIQDLDFDETFGSSARMDTTISSGVWLDGAHPGVVGGDGRHGSFDPTIGVSGGNGIYIFDTDNQTIPGRLTLDGLPQTVTDGKFYFTDFTLSSGNVLKFTGTHVPQIFVRGKIDVGGRIELNADDMVGFNSRSSAQATVMPGQPGGLPGIGGGRGGRGGNRCLGTGYQPIYDGVSGEDVRVPAGHAYAANVVGTGGRGSAAYPATCGMAPASVIATFLNIYSGQCAPGGSGGGFWLAGGSGYANTSLAAVQAGPVPVGGSAFNLFPVPAGTSSLDHFLVGGSGGGGGGSHAFYALAITGYLDLWKAGAGGSGGGGTMAIRGGSDFNLRATAVLQSRGGNGTNFADRGATTNQIGNACPGGGGSGGTFLLQSGSRVVLEGRIDTSGGLGGTIENAIPANASIPGRVVAGGNGSSGTYRLEAPQTSNVITLGATFTPNLDPARNVGQLTDTDDVVGCTSTWRSIGRIFPPEWVRFVMEIDSTGNGVVDQVYTDDPSYSLPTGSTAQLFAAPFAAGIPVKPQFQGARVSSTTNLPEPNTTPGPWRDFVNDVGASLNLDGATGFRFQLLFNRGLYPNAVVKKLTVTVRG